MTATSNGESVAQWNRTNGEIMCLLQIFTASERNPPTLCYLLLVIGVEDKEDLGTKMFEILGPSVRKTPAFPNQIPAPAILVQGHGLFVYGDTIDETLLLVAAFEELFEILMKTKQ